MPPPFPGLLMEPRVFMYIRRVVYHWVACLDFSLKLCVWVHGCTHMCEGQRTALDTVPSTPSCFLRQRSLTGLELNKQGRVLGLLWRSSCLCCPVLGLQAYKRAPGLFVGSRDYFFPDTWQIRKLSHILLILCTQFCFSSGTWICTLGFTLHEGFALFISLTLLE